MKAKVLKSKTLKVDYLARVEGECGMFVKIKNNEISDIKFKIFEPPRFFEAFLRGRHYSEAPDITARICGICPVAYQMSSTQAIENALDVKVDNQIRNLRRLLYCGEWIESHSLHIYMLHAPDFLECQDAFQIAGKFPEIIKRGLELKKIGNELMTVVGGREIHPINVRIGGFYRIPTRDELRAMIQKLKWAIEASCETVKWVSKFNYPDFEQDYEFVSLTHSEEYPILDGRIISNKGLDISVQEYENHFVEEHVKHSNALHSSQAGKGLYLVGPLARYYLNFDKLTTRAKKAARDAGLSNKCLNPFKSIIIRSVELVFACEEALKLIENYKQPEFAFQELHPIAGKGCSCTEAPRGLLYHRYRLADDESISNVKIVPPTSQNQKVIEHDLFEIIKKNIKLTEDKLQWMCEQAIRNYDPCISCATHCLRLKIFHE